MVNIPKYPKSGWSALPIWTLAQSQAAYLWHQIIKTKPENIALEHMMHEHKIHPSIFY